MLEKMDKEFERLKNDYLRKKRENEIEESKERLMYYNRTRISNNTVEPILKHGLKNK